MAEPRSDGKERPTSIPEKILQNRANKKYITKMSDQNPDIVLEKDIAEKEGDDYSVDLSKNKLLANEEEKYDKIPRFKDGKIISFKSHSVLSLLFGALILNCNHIAFRGYCVVSLSPIMSFLLFILQPLMNFLLFLLE